MQIPPLSKFSYFFFIVISLLYVSRCLKITEKVSFNIASEASYVYILSGQKSSKLPKNNQFDKFLRSQSVTRQVNLKGQKLMENAKIEKI